MAQILIKIIPTKKVDFIKETLRTKRAYESFQGHLASETRNYLRSCIIPKRSGSKGNLARSIQKVVTTVNGEYYAGVGKKAHMNSVAPYWYIVNYGHKGGTSTPYIPNNGNWARGSFGRGQKPNKNLRGSGIGTERWHDRSGGYAMKARNPIIAKNFIQKTRDWLASYWETNAMTVK